MNQYPQVFYGIIDLKLTSILHIQGAKEERFYLMTNGQGEYIIPATSTMGAIRHYLKDDAKGISLGTSKETGQITLYDMVCEDVTMERRVSVQLDNHYMSAVIGRRNQLYFIGQGMKTQLRMQAFLKDEQQLQDMIEIFADIAGGIQRQEITFGAWKSNGAGAFEVTDARYHTLDLTRPNDMMIYLQGIENGFMHCKIHPELPDMNNYNQDVYELYGSILDGILINSGERAGIADKMSVKKTVDGKEIYYIPSGTIKGYIRAYASFICEVCQIEPHIVEEIFGNQSSRCYIHVNDADISEADSIIYNKLRIDPWLGSTVNAAKMDEEVVNTSGDFLTKITVRISRDLELAYRGYANAFVFLALRDLGLSQTALGMGASYGHGRITGSKLLINGAICEFEDGKLNCESCQEDVLNYVKILGGNADEEQ